MRSFEEYEHEERVPFDIPFVNSWDGRVLRVAESIAECVGWSAGVAGGSARSRCLGLHLQD
jgi:hypothetical protein